MKSSIHQDIVALNKRYLHLVRHMVAEKHTDFLLGVPRTVAEKIKAMTFDEIDKLAEDMVAPCFIFNFSGTTFDQFTSREEGAERRAYMTNILVTRMTLDAHN